MFEQDYKALYDQIQPSPSVKKQTAHRITAHFSGRRPKSLSRRAIVLAVVLALLLVGTALAVTWRSPILNRLFGEGAPSRQAESALVRSGEEAASQGIVLKLEEYLADEHTLNLAWSVTSTRNQPVYYRTWAVIDDSSLAESEQIADNDPGLPYGGYDESLGDGSIIQLTPEANCYTSWCASGWTQSIDKPLTVTIYACAYTTGLTAVPSGYSHGELCFAQEGDPALSALKAAEASGSLLIASDLPLCYVNSYGAYAQAQAQFSGQSLNLDQAALAALEESGLFRPLVQLCVETEILPASAQAQFALSQSQSFLLPDRTVELTQLTIDAASTLIRYDVILEGTPDADPGTSWYLIADPQGRVLNTDWLLSLSGAEPQIVQRNGKTVTVIHYSMAGESPITSLPHSLTFLPVCNLPRQAGESSQHYWQRVAEQASPENCFTLPLT